MIRLNTTNQILIVAAYVIQFSNAFHQNYLTQFNQLSSTTSNTALSHNKNNGVYESDVVVTNPNNHPNNHRRSFIFSAILSSYPLLVSEDALAFPNKISDKYDDKPKRKGSKPKGMGISTRVGLSGDEYMGLKECGAAPNCFCSTDSIEDDPEHSIPRWSWPKSISNRSAAFQELKSVLDAYKPGQSNIDGGGFQVVTFNPDTGYLYAQFESVKNGFVDDLEIAYIAEAGGDQSVQIRSSSRIGYLDYGVNAKRINFIANMLREKGWDASGVDFSTHRDYASQNGVY